MIVERRHLSVGLVLLLGGTITLVAFGADPVKPEGETPSKGKASEVELVENLLKARREYWVSLDKLRQHYIANSDIEKTKWAEEEIRSYHRMMKYSYRLDIKDVPPPTLQPKQNIPEANNLFRRAVEYHNKGFGEELLDNQRRSEILFQGILERFPESDKIADVAYHLGELYESYRPKPQYLRAAAYYERSFQWNKSSSSDARLKAAQVYDKHLKMQEKAKELYKAVINHDSDPARVAEAEKRLKELSMR
jgi:TolA-binding protein